MVEIVGRYPEQKRAPVEESFNRFWTSEGMVLALWIRFRRIFAGLVDIKIKGDNDAAHTPQATDCEPQLQGPFESAFDGEVPKTYICSPWLVPTVPHPKAHLRDLPPTREVSWLL